MGMGTYICRTRKWEWESYGDNGNGYFFISAKNSHGFVDRFRSCVFLHGQQLANECFGAADRMLEKRRTNLVRKREQSSFS